MQVTISVEQLEALAATITQTEQEKRGLLKRMIAAYAAIIAVQDPTQFARQQVSFADEDGHWDNSYPPKQVWKQRSGPRSCVIQELVFDEVATSSGFYYDYDVYTKTPELSVDCDGKFWKGTLTGTGRVGQFAAHPGSCDVHCDMEYDYADDDEIPISVLIEAEEGLRGLAFAVKETV